MSHIDDGELHMVLDGSVDLLGAERAAAVLVHVEECRECARRLEEERALRDEAILLMDGAAPHDGSPPGFEEVLAMAAAEASSTVAAPDPPTTQRRARGWTRGMTLGWAASVVLALGIGYVGAATFQPAVLSRPLPAGAASTDAAVEAVPRSFGRIGEPPRPAEASAGEAFRAPRMEEVARRARAEEASPADVPTPSTEAAPPVAVAPGPAGTADQPAPEARRSIAGSSASAVDALRDDAGPPSAEAVGAPPSRALAEGVGSSGGLRVLSARGAAGSDGPPVLELGHLLHSGEMVTVRWNWLGDADAGSAGPDTASTEAQVMDLLPTSVEREAPASTRLSEDQRARLQIASPSPAPGEPAADSVENARPASEADAAIPGTSTVTRRVGGWRVEVSGPISRDSLSTILDGLVPPGPR